MTDKIQTTFSTRRDAEMAVEHLVQEHGVDPAGIMLIADSDENTAGTQAAGGDLADGRRKLDTVGEPALAGRVRLIASVDDALTSRLQATLSNYGGEDV